MNDEKMWAKLREVYGDDLTLLREHTGNATAHLTLTQALLAAWEIESKAYEELQEDTEMLKDELHNARMKLRNIGAILDLKEV